MHDHGVLHSPSQQLFNVPNEQSEDELHVLPEGPHVLDLHRELQEVSHSPSQQQFNVPNVHVLLSLQMYWFVHAPSTAISPGTQEVVHEPSVHWPNGCSVSVLSVEQQLFVPHWDEL